MRSPRFAFGAAVSAAVLLVLSACVGDDPAPVANGEDDSGGGGVPDGSLNETGALDAGSDGSTPKPGSPDPTFKSGLVSLTLDSANAAAIDESGRIYIAGTHACGEGGLESGFAVIRLLADGNLDTSFGTGGRACHRLSTGSASFRDEPWAIVIDKDRLHLGGNVGKPTPPQAFGTGTIATFSLEGALLKSQPFTSNSGGSVWNLAIASEGTSYHSLVGALSSSTPSSTFGQQNPVPFDYDYGSGPTVFAERAETSVAAFSAVIPGGTGAARAYYGTGTTAGDFNTRKIAVVKFDLVTKALDLGWGGSGVATFNPVPSFVSDGQGIAVDGAGQAFVVGVAGVDPGGNGLAAHYGPLVVARFTAAGSVDATYGNLQSTGGGAFQSPTLRRVMARYEDTDLILDADGRVVVAGLADSAVDGETTAAATRVLANGKLDEGFGDAGVVTCGPTKSSLPSAVVRDPKSGKIVLVARNASEIHVCRFHP